MWGGGGEDMLTQYENHSFLVNEVECTAILSLLFDLSMKNVCVCALFILCLCENPNNGRMNHQRISFQGFERNSTMGFENVGGRRLG